MPHPNTGPLPIAGAHPGGKATRRPARSGPGRAAVSKLPDKSMDEGNMNGFGGPGQPGRGNIGMAVLAGAAVAIVGALIWGVIAYSTKYQFSSMAVPIGVGGGTVMGGVNGVRRLARGGAHAL